MTATKIDEALSAMGHGVNGSDEVRECDCDEQTPEELAKESVARYRKIESGLVMVGL